MPWKGNQYYKRGKLVAHWSLLRDADGNGVLVDPTVVIDWFDDFLGAHPYDCFTNYYVGEPLLVDGVLYDSGEHAYQAYKAANEEDHERVRTASTPDEAKLLGRSIPCRADWFSVSLARMQAIIEAKFTEYRKEGAVLMTTGNARLVEGTLWNDEWFGVNLEKRGRPGENHLGRLLETRRTALRGG